MSTQTAQSVQSASFVFRSYHFTVKRRLDGTLVYRDTAHLGGPWSNAANAVNNSSYHHLFRRGLRQAMEELGWKS